ncbi:Zinc finger protein AEBP2 [Liparis tanakae]|uniref:Zinc finger protein AEBP2 n=1 Tax=Liparis tanakae TaxID=230148 RepID=A0A4Z2IWX3_9TELE|nr:Zinc finger protein AEBP2 [Liparis tanakae]
MTHVVTGGMLGVETECGLQEGGEARPTCKALCLYCTSSLPDVWVNETERSQLKSKVVHLSQLPQDAAMLLDPNIYSASRSTPPSLR